MNCRSEVVPDILVQPGSRETADDAIYKRLFNK
jgi:hypothetical protein